MMKVLKSLLTSWLGLNICVALLTSPIVSIGSVPSSPSTQQTFTTLQPGGFRNITQNLPINVVFVGYKRGSGPQKINQSAFRSELPQTYRAINRTKNFGYGVREFIGTTFNYDYNFIYSNNNFENAFFHYLSSIAQPKPLTEFQELYNAQNHNSLDVSQNNWIDAPSVEKWLANNASSMLGTDPAQYTVFFINWYGRSDFKFHVYSKTNEPDPDTGINFGLDSDQSKMIAWGGTTPDDEEDGLGSLRRIWFYDLSAGPELWSDNWNVDDADLYGDGVPDYRIPPVWEYGNLSAYRPFNNLSGDLGKVLRYVAINTLFTTSPIYDPAITAPTLPTNIQLDMNLYQGDSTVNGRNFLKPGLIKQEVGELQPLNQFRKETTDQAFAGQSADVFRCFLTSVTPPYSNESCYGNRLGGNAFGDLFLYHSDNASMFLEGDGDYEVPVFIFNTTSELSPGFLGYADDNWVDGTQSFIFAFSNPYLRSLGFGMSKTVTHEVGHHLGLSHPHDGYDYETDTDYYQADAHHYSWSGDESNTTMGYLPINKDFSQFDRDNMNRYLTATYINQSNTVLPLILASPQANRVRGLLSTADQQAANSLIAYRSMNYLQASGWSKAAHQNVMRAASELNIQFERPALRNLYRNKSLDSRFIDGIEHLKTTPKLDR